MATGAVGVVRNAKRLSVMGKRPELLRRIQRRERQREREGRPLTENEKRAQLKATRKKLKDTREFLKDVPDPVNKHRIRAATAGWSIFAIALWFTPFQFIFGILAIAGIAFEVAGESFLWGILSAIIPGDLIFSACWIFASVIGIGLMLFAFTVFSMRGVNTLKGWGLGIFAIACTLNIAPLFNWFPWILVWVFYVIKWSK